MNWEIGVWEEHLPFTVYPEEDAPYESVRPWFTIVATSDKGHREVLVEYGTEDREAAEAFVKTVTHTPATNVDGWYPIPPVYGSEAWGPEAEYELACFEADAYNEPRPDWF